jgi:YD repeat-containing protein
MPRKRVSGRALLPFIIVLITVPGIGWGETYRSNEMGIPFERISSIRTDEYPYFVSITRENGREIKILHHEGEEVRRWVKARLESGRSEVTEYRKGVIEKITRYDSGERPMEISFFEEGTLIERFVYGYAEGRIISAVRYDGEGEVLRRYRYDHDSTGRLREYREVVSPRSERGTEEGSDTAEAPEGSRSRYLYTDGSIREEWHGDRYRGDMFRYNESGRLVLHEGWRDGQVVTRLTRTYSEEGRILTSRSADYQEGTVTLAEYDEGRIVRETIETAEGSRIEEITYSYDPEGNLVEKIRRAREVRERWDYSYDDSQLARTVYRRGGELVKTTEYRNEEDYTETIYRNGEPLVAVEYEDGKKMGEVPVR